MSQVNINGKIRSVSHEIRNQLSICDVYSEILKKHLQKANIKNPSIDNAINCIQRAAKLIGNELVELKSFDNLVFHAADSEKLLTECIEMSKVYVLDKNIEILGVFEQNVKILADENKFQACMINLIKNAIEAVEESGIVRVTSKLKEDKLVIWVEDDGIPIPEDKIEHIFEDGFTTKISGSGIGLYLCKTNINAQNGQINLVQSTNEKTVFEIIMPCVNINES